MLNKIVVFAHVDGQATFFFHNLKYIQTENGVV